jgi:conjugal transfer mating pair stabilization protein TraG
MLPTQTILTSANTAVLSAIFNGVAMISTLDSLVWGVAMAAAIWQIIKGVVQTPIDALKNGSNTITTSSINILISFLLAMALTSTSFQSKVIIEDQTTGIATQVDNVPFVISVIPATASLLASQIGTSIEQAYQGVGASTSILSSGTNGFIAPLKVLLSARSAMKGMGEINSQIHQIVEDCLDTGSGVDYAELNAKIMYAGNALPTPYVADPVVSIGTTTTQTSLGAMFAMAAKNQTAKVNMAIPGQSYDFASCSDAVNFVAGNITTAMNSANFMRAAIGSTNSSDVPNTGANYSTDQMSAIYDGIRQIDKTAIGNLAGGVAQSAAEMVNLMFYSTVKENLDCIKVNGASKSQCMASMEIADSIEQQNMDSAANASVSLAFAGQFGNIFLALIIGLSPVIIIFMMFAGVSAGKNIKVATHMIVWPMLIYTVGGVIVNGIIYTQISSFMSMISQSGVINQGTAAQMYRDFSMQIGTASALMAGLPILMSTIFVLGESAAAVSIANSIAGKDRFNEKTVAPDASAPSSISATGNMAKSDVTSQGIAVTTQTGAAKPIGSVSQGEIAASSAVSAENALTRTKQISQGQAITQAYNSGDVSAISKATGLTTEQATQSVADFKQAQSQKVAASHTADASKTADTTTQTSAQLAAKVSASTSGLPSASIEASLNTTSTSSDKASTSVKDQKTKEIADSDTASKTLSDSIKRASSTTNGTSNSKTLGEAQSAVDSYQTSLSSTETESDKTSASLTNSAKLNAVSGQITTSNVAAQTLQGGSYAKYTSKTGLGAERISQIANGSDKQKWDSIQAEERAKLSTGEIESLVGNDPRAVGIATQNVINERSANRIMSDANVSNQTRALSQAYVAESYGALSGTSTLNMAPPKAGNNIASPANTTGTSYSQVKASTTNKPQVSTEIAPDLTKKLDSIAPDLTSKTSALNSSGQSFNDTVSGTVEAEAHAQSGAQAGRMAGAVGNNVANAVIGSGNQIASGAKKLAETSERVNGLANDKKSVSDIKPIQ